jgi:hypothetical protein
MDADAEEEREEAREGWSMPTRLPVVLSMGRGGAGCRRRLGSMSCVESETGQR